MISYDNPLDRAKAMLAELESFATSNSVTLPEQRSVQIGDIVRDCESVIVSVGNLSPDPLYDPVECVYPRTATFLVEIIRNCAITFNDDGTTDHEALLEVSETGIVDGQLLNDFAAQLDGWSSKLPWSVVWSLSDAGLQVSSLQLTIGVP